MEDSESPNIFSGTATGQISTEKDPKEQVLGIFFVAYAKYAFAEVANLIIVLYKSLPSARAT